MTVVENHPPSTRAGGITGHGFVAGQSGNPGGRPKGLARRVRELVGDDGQLVAGYLVAVVINDAERTRDRLEAARLLADRGWGKPTQTVDVELTPQLPVAFADQLVDLLPEELDLLISLAERDILAFEDGSSGGQRLE